MNPTNDSSAPHAPSRASVHSNEGIKVVRSRIVRRPPAVLYAFWRNLENLSKIISHSTTITGRSALESHWSVGTVAGRRLEWDALIINDHPNELIAWRSADGADIPNAGTVRFAADPAGDGTEVTVALEYTPPGGKLGLMLLKASEGVAAAQVTAALDRFKALMET